MKRHTQQSGIRDWYGDHFLDLQAEPLKVLDQFLGQFGGYVVSGCEVTANGAKYDVAPGLVLLSGTDAEGKTARMVVPYSGTATAQTLPLYLTLAYDIIEDTYGDGEDKPVTYDYKAVASNIQPSTPFVEIKASGTMRFLDAIQSSTRRFITDGERTNWNAKETPAGSQEKATAAVASAKGYTDTRETAIRADMASGDATALSSAKSYADGVGTGIVGGAPSALNTLYKLAAAIGNNSTFSTWVTNQLAQKGDATRIVYVSDFETLNPSSSLVDSISGGTFTLAQGESCQFYAAYNANGKPWMGSGTLGATNNSLAAIYYWAGTITRIYGTYYMVTAYGANTTTLRPQMATRVYYSGTRYDWIVSSDFSSRSTSGYVKLPSGIMIQWGYITPNSSGVGSITFPISFTSIFTFVPSTITSANYLQVVHTYSISTTSASTRSHYWTGTATGFVLSSERVYWVAIGTWQ